MIHSEPDLKQAHNHSFGNRKELQVSRVCGCFYCRSTFAPDQIVRWVDEGRNTALCPLCGIDSVIGLASGYPVSDPSFLSDMHELWFERLHVESGGDYSLLDHGVQEQGEPFHHDAEDDYRHHFTPEQIAAIEAGLDAIERGDTMPHDQVVADIKAKFGW